MLYCNCVKCKKLFDYDDTSVIETCDIEEGRWVEFDVTFCPECDTENRI